MSKISRLQLYRSIISLEWFEALPIKINGIKAVCLFEKHEGFLYPSLIAADSDFENGGMLSNINLLHPPPNIGCLRGFIDKYVGKYGCIRIVAATMFEKPTMIISHVYQSEGKLSIYGLFYVVTPEVASIIQWSEILTV